MSEQNIIKTKFIEMPAGVSMDDKVRLLNVWISDMQRNGLNILSTNFHTQENVDGSFSDGFIVEYRESS